MNRTAQFKIILAALLASFPICQIGGFGQSAASAATLPAGASAAHNGSVAPAVAPPPFVAPASEVAGSDEQRRVMAAVHAAWSQSSWSKDGDRASSDISFYDVRITVSGANDKVTLSAKNPITKRIRMPEGMDRLETESPTYFYFVRRSDFKVLASVAVL